MHATRTADSPAPDVTTTERLRGKGIAMTIYLLYLLGIMMVVTAPVGVLVAHLMRRRVGSWTDTHLRFQIATFWISLPALAAAAGLLLWQPAAGYLLVTAWLAWAVGRCGVGIHRLMENHPIDEPGSLWFGGTRVTLHD
jgi:uncharacterized membrane protein